MLFREESGKDSESQITAFEDTWHWDRSAENTYDELVTDSPPQIGRMIGALPVFGGENFRNEVIWKRATDHSDPTRWGRVHDTLFYYTKSDQHVWNNVYIPYDEAYKKRFRYSDHDGRTWTDGDITAKGLSGGGYTYEYKGADSLWRVPLRTMERLDAEGRLHFTEKGGIRLKKYLDELSKQLGVRFADI